MKTSFTKTVCLLGLAGLMSGCASSYKPIVPQNINYTAKTESNDVLLEYKYDVLLERGNKKYAKREKKKFVQVAAVKITNNSYETITLGEDSKFLAGNNSFTPLDPTVSHSQLKQGVPIYLLYLLFSNGKLITEETYVNGMKTGEKSFPIGLIVGPGLTLYNMLKAGNANKQFLAEMQQYHISNKQVRPGETVYGLVAVPNSSYNPLYLKTGPDAQVQR
ncbi:hypothetical protein H9Q13_07810 [Pontibacter sp. JH31]|uniref:Lipoprotein n=1 Tax=Pontibacter aquaedesilientis TaxID=2766980 RepID=A0ABR7XFI3_9BACT|nr:hypothetical protein [Pontibacter aquaedesilientis]MBD1397068.1 hypothetical protein [Pontibacter aquaedesilientis]